MRESFFLGEGGKLNIIQETSFSLVRFPAPPFFLSTNTAIVFLLTNGPSIPSHSHVATDSRIDSARQTVLPFHLNGHHNLQPTLDLKQERKNATEK